MSWLDGAILHRKMPILELFLCILGHLERIVKVRKIEFWKIVIFVLILEK